MKSVVNVIVKIILTHKEPKTITELNNCINEMDYGFISTTDGIEVGDMEIIEAPIINFDEEEE